MKKNYIHPECQAVQMDYGTNLMIINSYHDILGARGTDDDFWDDEAPESSGTVRSSGNDFDDEEEF